MITYGFTKDLAMPFERVKEAVFEELKREGFGVLTEIDLREKFREKLGLDFRRYVILGVCHPATAHKAVLAEKNIGLMLPCNVIVFEEGEKTVLSVIKPTVAMQMIDNEGLRPLAKSIEEKLRKIFDAVAEMK